MTTTTGPGSALAPQRLPPVGGACGAIPYPSVTRRCSTRVGRARLATAETLAAVGAKARRAPMRPSGT